MYGSSINSNSDTLPKVPHRLICVDMQMGAMLDDRKISARALFDYNSQRQTLMGVSVRVGQTMCYTLPFHVFVSSNVFQKSIKQRIMPN